jgi:hypothetical protein
LALRFCFAHFAQDKPYNIRIEHGQEAHSHVKAKLAYNREQRVTLPAIATWSSSVNG